MRVILNREMAQTTSTNSREVLMKDPADGSWDSLSQVLHSSTLKVSWRIHHKL